jgi:hypothetical protein
VIWLRCASTREPTREPSKFEQPQTPRFWRPFSKVVKSLRGLIIFLAGSHLSARLRIQRRYRLQILWPYKSRLARDSTRLQRQSIVASPLRTGECLKVRLMPRRVALTTSEAVGVCGRLTCGRTGLRRDAGLASSVWFRFPHRTPGTPLQLRWRRGGGSAALLHTMTGDLEIGAIGTPSSGRLCGSSIFDGFVELGCVLWGNPVAARYNETVRRVAHESINHARRA